MSDAAFYNMTPFISWLVILAVVLIGGALVAVWDYLVPSRIVAWLHRKGIVKSEAEFLAQSQRLAEAMRVERSAHWDKYEASRRARLDQLVEPRIIPFLARTRR